MTHGSGRVAVWGDDWIVLSEEITRVDDRGARPTATFWKNALRWASKRDPNATVGSFCENWAKAACSANVVLACSGAAKIDAALTDACVNRQRGFCEGLVPAKGYSSQFASQCLNAVKRAYSDARLTAPETATVRHRGDPCNHLIKGTQGAGESCSSDDDCDTLENYLCVSKTGEGSCQIPTVVDNGDSCAAPSATCHVGYYCGLDDTCVPSKTAARSALPISECATGLDCDPDSATCTARVSAVHCSKDDDCATAVCEIPVHSSEGRVCAFDHARGKRRDLRGFALSENSGHARAPARLREKSACGGAGRARRAARSAKGRALRAQELLHRARRAARELLHRAGLHRQLAG